MSKIIVVWGEARNHCVVEENEEDAIQTMKNVMESGIEFDDFEFFIVEDERTPVITFK